jgi:hypothetical protein
MASVSVEEETFCPDVSAERDAGDFVSWKGEQPPKATAKSAKEPFQRRRTILAGCHEEPAPSQDRLRGRCPVVVVAALMAGCGRPPPITAKDVSSPSGIEEICIVVRSVVELEEAGQLEARADAPTLARQRSSIRDG